MSMQEAIAFITTDSSLKFTDAEAVYCYGMSKMTVIEELPVDESQHIIHKWNGASTICSK